MAKHYTTMDFFRQIPNALLARYFQGQGLFADLDFAAMKEAKSAERLSGRGLQGSEWSGAVVRVG